MSGVILLVDTAEGDVVGVRFPSTVAARDWEDSNLYTVTARGIVRLETKREALKLAAVSDR